VEHLVYASSSSVYGANTQMPFSVHYNVDHPISLYAATKKANELMAHTYADISELTRDGGFNPFTSIEDRVARFVEWYRKFCGEQLNSRQNWRNENMEGIEIIDHNGIRYAEVIWARARVNKTFFFSPPSSSFQFGLLAHEAGFRELAHYHKPFERMINDLQQMFVMQRGVVVIELYDDNRRLIREVQLNAGDAVVLIHGIHGLRVVEDFQAISVKQGPFIGAEHDKINVEVTR